MHVRLRITLGNPRQPIAAVVCLRAETGPDDPLQGKENMRAKKHETSRKGHEVAEQKLDRVGVQGRQGVGRGELVVHFVDLTVQCRSMERTVAIVEEHFIDCDVREKQHKALAVRRERAAEPDPARVCDQEHIGAPDAHEVGEGPAHDTHAGERCDPLVGLELVAARARHALCNEKPQRAMHEVDGDKNGENAEAERLIGILSELHRRPAPHGTKRCVIGSEETGRGQPGHGRVAAH